MDLEETLLLLPMKVNETSIKTIKADTNTPIYIYIYKYSFDKAHQGVQDKVISQDFTS